jgi:nucleoside-diphosphate kinase
VATLLTLGMLKPDAIESGKAGLIIAHLQREGFAIRAARLTRLSQAQAAKFYEVHRDRPFYGDLVAFMTSGPVFPMALEREDAVAHFRTVIGATDPAEEAVCRVQGQERHPRLRQRRERNPGSRLLLYRERTCRPVGLRRRSTTGEGPARLLDSSRCPN